MKVYLYVKRKDSKDSRRQSRHKYGAWGDYNSNNTIFLYPPTRYKGKLLSIEVACLYL
jgi:hypothetical protein